MVPPGVSREQKSATILPERGADGPKMVRAPGAAPPSLVARIGGYSEEPRRTSSGIVMGFDISAFVERPVLVHRSANGRLYFGRCLADVIESNVALQTRQTSQMRQSSIDRKVGPSLFHKVAS